jgi:hypothetical protein
VKEIQGQMQDLLTNLQRLLEESRNTHVADIKRLSVQINEYREHLEEINSRLAQLEALTERIQAIEAWLQKLELMQKRTGTLIVHSPVFGEKFFIQRQDSRRRDRHEAPSVLELEPGEYVLTLERDPDFRIVVSVERNTVMGFHLPFIRRPPERDSEEVPREERIQ